MLVALVDDHDIVGVAVEAVVDEIDGLQFVGAEATVRGLLTRHPQIDIVLLDLRLADDSSPAENVAQLAAAGARVVVFTSGESRFLLRSVAKCPIYGVVLKSAPRTQLADALRAVASGAIELSAEWASAIDNAPDVHLAHLSPQEQRVLALFARGLKAQSVAFELGISPHTVEDHVSHIRRKFAEVGRPAYTKIDLYRRAVEDGILPSP